MQEPTQSIVLTGQGYWARSLAEGLERTCGLRVGVASFDSARQALRLAPWLALVRADTVVVVGFRPQAATARGRAFDAMFTLVRRIGRPRRVIYYWIGTDVYHAVADVRAGRAGKRFFRAVAAAEHMAGSLPLARDLAGIGIHAEVVDFPWTGASCIGDPPPLPERFTVLTYVPDARSAFYGGPEVLTAAHALADIEFLVVGGTGSWTAEVPPNVRFLGWQNDMEPWYAAASCVVRMVEHDSVGGTVGEALTRGRAVVYSRPFEHTVFVPYGDAQALAGALRRLADGYDATSPDLETAAWAREFFDPARRFARLAEKITGN